MAHNKGAGHLATAMFRMAWDARRDQAQDIVRSARQQITTLDKQIDTLLAGILEASNARVIRTYEDKIAMLERKKVLIGDKLNNQAEPKGSFEEKLEPVLTFLARPWKLWESGHIALKRAVLKLAFTDPIHYCRKEGARTTQIAFPFKALGTVLTPEVLCGAGGGTRTPTSLRKTDFHTSYGFRRP